MERNGDVQVLPVSRLFHWVAIQCGVVRHRVPKIFNCALSSKHPTREFGSVMMVKVREQLVGQNKELEARGELGFEEEGELPSERQLKIHTFDE